MLPTVCSSQYRSFTTLCNFALDLGCLKAIWWNRREWETYPFISCGVDREMVSL